MCFVWLSASLFRFLYLVVCLNVRLVLWYYISMSSAYFVYSVSMVVSLFDSLAVPFHIYI